MYILPNLKLTTAGKKGQFPLRRILSHSLITILLFLSPITFSTDKVPNFQPDCETHISLKEKSRTALAVLRNIVSEKTAVSEIQAAPSFILSSVFLLKGTASFSSPSRAPPA
jgi:hypothetical protein